MGTLVPLLI